MRISLRVILYLAVTCCSSSEAATTFQIPDSMLAEPLVLIAYGDIPYPQLRAALAARSPWHWHTKDRFEISLQP